MKSKTIELLEPFEHHQKQISTITLKQPSGGLYAQLGEPRIWIRNTVGGYWVEQPQVIQQYLDRLIDHPDGAELMKLMDLADAMQLKDELIGFFEAAEKRLTARSLAASSSAQKP